MLSLLHEACNEQISLAKELHKNPKTRAPFETVCLASFGSSLHEAVTSYFYLKLGASTADIGSINSITLGVGLFVNPIVGMHMDMRGGVGAMMLASLACALGCFLRGLARSVGQLFVSAAILGFGGGSLELIVVTYFSAVLDRDRRSTILSGFVVQTVALRIFAKAIFPIFAYALTTLFPNDEVIRFRIALSFCWFFCFYGVIRIYFSRPYMVLEPLGKFVKNKALSKGEAFSTGPCSAMDAAECGGIIASPSFMLAASAVLITSVATTIMTILWPLMVMDRFGWGTEQFSVLLLLVAIGRVVATSVVPQCERRLGTVGVALCASVLAFVTVLLLIGLGVLWPHTRGSNNPLQHSDDPDRGLLQHQSINHNDTDGWIWNSNNSNSSTLTTLHTLFVLIHLIALRCLEVLVRSLATLVLPPSWTSRSFGLVATLTACGGVIGSFVGTALYASASTYPLYLSLVLQLVLIVFFLTSCYSQRHGRKTIMTKETIQCDELRSRYDVELACTTNKRESKPFIVDGGVSGGG